MNPWDPVVLRPGGLSSLSGGELLLLMKRLAAAERTLSVYALAQLAEIQRRKLYEDAGFSSMFAYCMGELGYSESNTCRRLLAADAVRKFPETLSLIRSGSVTICSLSLVSKHLARENCTDILKRIEGKSLRDVERIVAELAPRPDTRDMIRSLQVPEGKAPALEARTPPAAESPAAEPTAAEPTAAEPPVVRALYSQSTECRAAPPSVSLSREKIMPRSPDRVQFSFTGSGELRRVVERCRELLWHRHPAGRLDDVFLELGKSYLRLRDPELLPPSRPKPARMNETRSIPRWVRSVVYRRDEGRCTFRSGEGRRCEARRSLEYDHVRPWAKGGSSDDPGNIRLLCRAHNGWAARAAGLA